MYRPKKRHTPYRLLCYSQFGLHDCIQRHKSQETGDLHVTIQTSKFASLLRVSSHRFAESLEWLARARLIRDLETGYGWATYTIPDTATWNSFAGDAVDPEEAAHA